MHPTQINKWKKQALTGLPEVFSNNQQQMETAHEQELTLLYEQSRRLKVENEFFKKSVVCLPADRRSLLEPKHPRLSVR